MPHSPLTLLSHTEKPEQGELYFKIDEATGLFAVIAIHSLKRGPALGGCRWISYADPKEAIEDALRLAKGMAAKSAICYLPHGGGKAVLIRPQQKVDRDRYFAAYCTLINELGGNYITAADSGTGPAEMDIISKYTPYVTSTSMIGNPAIYTAQGVLYGMQAAVRFKLHQKTLKGLHIAIQGTGQVGYLVAKACHLQGAKLTVSDQNILSAERCVHEFGATIVSTDEIHRVPCDIFSPCALGAILNQRTIPALRCAIIAGSANNQLETPFDGQSLEQRGILYAPDYVISAGGLIQASGRYYGANMQHIEKKISHISETLTTIFKRAQETHQSTHDIADMLAMERLEEQVIPW